MKMIKQLDFFFHLISTSIKASISLQGAFVFEICLMIANNLIFFSVWWIFFHQFQDIAGWQIKEMTLMMAIVTGSYGAMQIFFGGIRQLSRAIIQGDLDPFMTQPKNLLIHVISSRSFAKGWGHIITTLALILIEGLYDRQTIILILIGIVSGCLVFTAMNIIIHSLTFWLGALESLAHKYSDTLFLLALYPAHIYSGFLNLMMFTLIPAGVIGYLPVELIREFSWFQLLILICCALFFWGIALVIFYCGLKRYESGNQFGNRA